MAKKIGREFMQTEINKRVLQVKYDETELNIFVEEFKPFIISVAEKALNRYVDCKNDEEWSVSLFAFNEAIHSYEIEKGNFLSFAQMVIKMRLIDHFRKEVKHKNIVYINKQIDDEEEIDLSEKQAIEDYREDNINELRRMEIEQLTKELHKWDITFDDLVKASPKRGSTRKIYNTILKYILSKEELIDYIITKQCIPIAEIEKNTLVPRKKIERARKYIISVLLVVLGDYQYIKDYVNLEVNV